jgi:DNA-binding MarR family transcriptional regulator
VSSAEAGLSHQGNLLGALVLALSDRMGEATSAAAGGSGELAAALSSLEDFLGSPTIGLLREVLGLTPSGAVRLTDRLEALGYVHRSTGKDARSRHVVLTASGHRAARNVRRARAGVLESALAPLSSNEQAELDALVAKALLGLKREPGATRWTCRLCDTKACGRDEGRCPFVGSTAD